MTANPNFKTRLELTWVGKEQRPRLEPRILIEDKSLSYRAEAPKSLLADDAGPTATFDNLLIHGDNLLALKALEQQYAGKVKCIFIDPPYNTGSAFTHYDDGVEHSLWLTLMRDRLELLRTLLSEDGSIWITIDDNEAHYLKVLCDEVFGRSQFIANIVWRSSDNSNNDAKTISVDHNHILVFAKRAGWISYKSASEDKRTHFSNPDSDPRGAWFDGNPLNSPKPRPNLMYNITAPNGNVVKHPPNGWRWEPGTLQAKMRTGEIRFNETMTGIRRRTYLDDMKGLPPSSLWTDLLRTGHNRQAKGEQKALSNTTAEGLFETPKPERLLAEILSVATLPNDLVLDSFAGSGTTGAVAQKMGRRWIMVELGDHCRTHIVPRLRKVIDGTDPGGVTTATGWRGGGGFRYLDLAPSLLKRDAWGNWVINPAYNAEMLAEAMCKHMGYTYAPSTEVYWQHGQSTERDYLYVTTGSLTHEQLRALSLEVGDERTLLICCKAFMADARAFANLSIKKIPQAVLAKCEWDQADDTLRLPVAGSADPAPAG